MKPICVPCQRFYRPKKTGFYFIESMPIYNGAPSGNSHPELWRPYKIWSGDLWECLGCGHQTISGVGVNPISIKHEPDFEMIAEKLKAIQFEVNDC